ncbi:MAG TPA: DUF4198 domain-containing protein [Candidatus Polarisedimenticolaceae bacterium]
MHRILALLLLSASPVAAHDFWIEPSTFRPEPGRRVEFSLRSGENKVGEPVPRREARIDRFELLGQGKAVPIRGAEGRDPAGEATPSAPGPWVAVYRSRPLSITLAPAKFEAYLREEGLEHVIAAREAKGQTRVDGREIYSRCAKALMGTGADRVTGLRLELIAEKDPAALGTDRALPVRLEFEGKPLSGALVLARREGAGDRPARGRTDAAGRVTFELDGEGPWLLSAVHMVPAPDGVDADWESLWASLTFRASPAE